jgi:hypothetical protein
MRFPGRSSVAKNYHPKRRPAWDGTKPSWPWRYRRRTRADIAVSNRRRHQRRGGSKDLQRRAPGLRFKRPEQKNRKRQAYHRKSGQHPRQRRKHWPAAKLFEQLKLCKADGSYLRELAKKRLLVIDDFGLEVLDTAGRLFLLELLEDRHGRASTIFASQLPVSQWHQVIGEPTIADAICDRIVHTADRIELKGESVRKLYAHRGGQRQKDPERSGRTNIDPPQPFLGFWASFRCRLSAFGKNVRRGGPKNASSARG